MVAISQAAVAFTGTSASDLIRNSNSYSGIPLRSLGRARLGSKKREFSVVAKLRKVKKHGYPWSDNPDPNVKGGVLMHLSHFKPLKEKPKPVTLDFEKPLVALEKKIIDVRRMANETGLDFSNQIVSLENKYQQVLSSSDKSKPKTTVRSGKMTVTSKGIQQQASPMRSANQSVAGVAVKSEVTKMSRKQLVVLKPGWENGVSHSPKDVASPTNNASRAANNQFVASAVPSAPLRNLNNPKPSSMERKLANLNMIPGFSVEKRHSASSRRCIKISFRIIKYLHLNYSLR